MPRMKKLLDLALILVVLGAPILIFGVLPDRERDPSPPVGAGDPLPLPTAPEDGNGGKPDLRAPSNGEPFAAADSGDRGTSTPTVDRVPPGPTDPARGLVIEGRSYRGASSPLPGVVAVTADRGPSEQWVADRDGRFDATIPPGRLFLLDPVEESSTEVVLPIPPLDEAEGASALLNVHRFFRDDPDEFFTPVSAFVLQCDAMGPPLLAVRGRSQLPDGGEIAVRVLAAGYQLESMMLRVEDGEFSGVLRFAERQYHSGAYVLQFAWSPLMATRRTLEALEGTAWGSVEGEIQRDLGIFLGTPGEANTQDQEIRRYFSEALDELEAVRDFMLVVSAEARRKRNRLLNDEARAERLRRSELAEAHRGLFRQRRLVVERWRELIDERIPAIVGRYLDAEAMPYPTKSRDASHNLVELAKLVHKHAKLESTRVYEALGLELDPRNFVVDKDFSSETERQQTLDKMDNCIRAIVEALER